MAERARALTRRWPSHVVLTHLHGDHTGGIEGSVSVGSPGIHATAVTRDLTLASERAREEASESRLTILADVAVIPDTPTTIDLGGRFVRLVPRSGHTPSDVTIELDDHSVMFCGDLVWNRMFPNYRDAIPSRLSQDIRALRRNSITTYVPGHGPLGNNSDLELFIQLIDSVEEAARRAHERGVPAAEAAKAYSVPPALGEWLMFSERYYEVALRAWERELGA
jgi:glyoxylase-like metal-dependent hydrolase (beta-lactamase superfamily II)